MTVVVEVQLRTCHFVKCTLYSLARHLNVLHGSGTTVGALGQEKRTRYRTPIIQYYPKLQGSPRHLALMLTRDTRAACPGACRCRVVIYREQRLPRVESPLTTCALQGEAHFRRCASGRIPRDLNVAIWKSERGVCYVCCVCRREGSGGRRVHSPIRRTPLQDHEYLSYVCCLQPSVHKQFDFFRSSQRLQQ